MRDKGPHEGTPTSRSGLFPGNEVGENAQTIEAGKGTENALNAHWNKRIQGIACPYSAVEREHVNADKHCPGNKCRCGWKLWQ